MHFVLLITPNINHKDTLFKFCGILKIDLYLQQTLLFVLYVISRNLPNSFTDVFKCNRDMAAAAGLTRQSDLLHIDRCQYKFPFKCVESMGILVLN